MASRPGLSPIAYLIYRSLVLSLVFCSPVAGESPLDTALAWLAEHERYVEDIAARLWEHAEPAHHERETSAILREELEANGFTVEAGVSGLPTAFVASFGEGRPVLGLVALLDALPGMSQERLATERNPRDAGRAGHGCGHNLIGAADLGAAVAVRRAMEAHGLPGTLRLYGAPAEEIYHGGIFMVRDGLFDDLDALLFWHPSSVTGVMSQSGLAMDSLRFVFTGRASDATDAASRGRNALSAAYELVRRVDEAREEWPETTVVNHVLGDGGEIPSIVPERAELWYFLHARNRARVDRHRDQMTRLATSIATTRETPVEIQRLSATRRWLINRELSRLLFRFVTEERAPAYTTEEAALAQSLRSAFSPVGDAPFATDVLPLRFTDEPVPISDDTADASWVTPRGGFLVACFPSGTPSHTWQWTAAATSSFAHKGMLRAARTLVKTALELYTNPDALAAVRREFTEAVADSPYESPLPRGQGPFRYLARPAPR